MKLNFILFEAMLSCLSRMLSDIINPLCLLNCQVRYHRAFKSVLQCLLFFSLGSKSNITWSALSPSLRCFADLQARFESFPAHYSWLKPRPVAERPLFPVLFPSLQSPAAHKLLKFVKLVCSLGNHALFLPTYHPRQPKLIVLKLTSHACNFGCGCECPALVPLPLQELGLE